MFFDKPETGIILLDNLRFGDHPLKMLDKKKFLTVQQSKASAHCQCSTHKTITQSRFQL